MRDADHREVDEAQARRANRTDWDTEADEYQRLHGPFLGDVGFVWSPEGADEAELGLLGDVRGLRIVELGCGAAQCGRWLRSRGATAVGLDLSMRQLQHSRRIDELTSVDVPVLCATATSLPFPDDSFDVAFSAFGAFGFVVDIAAAFAEVRRVLRVGGRLVFSVVHPARRMFADDPSPRGMTITRSYFDRTPYVETDDEDRVTYVEPHHTMADWVNAIRGSGLVLDGLLEPEWPTGHTRVWGGWGPVRGALLPGTAIFRVSRP